MAEFLPSFEFVSEKVKEIIIQNGAETLFYREVPIEHRIYTLLRLLNISPSMKGYTYICDILKTYTTNEYNYTLPSLTKYVYPTSQRIERCIRTCMQKSQKNCDPFIFSYFFSNEKKLTNSTFLAQLIAFLKLISK